MNEHRGAALLLAVLPPAGKLLDDRDYGNAEFQDGLYARGNEPCIPPTDPQGFTGLRQDIPPTPLIASRLA